jgi:hypothetical protein
LTLCQTFVYHKFASYLCTEIDNFVNKTLRVKFPKEVKNILNEKRISNKKIVEMQKFIEESKEYKNLTKKICHI